MNGTGRPPTVYDVAAACGVAASTVSRAFSRPDRVSASTRARVLEVAAEMGYRPSPIARALPSGRTTNLGLLVPDITNPYFFDLIRGAERQAAAAGYTLLLADTEESGEVEGTLVQRLSRSVDGLILGASRLADSRLEETAAQTPLVVVNRKVDPIPQVIIDSAHGIRQAAEHLASLGHRRIAYLSGPRASWQSARRWRVLQDTGRRLDLDLTKIGPLAPTVAGGAAAADAALLKAVTAIVTFNDLLAIGVLRRLSTRSIPVPDQVSVVGSDDIFGADFANPPLTTLTAPIETAGRSAVDLLLSTMGPGVASQRRNVVLPTRLTIRESTAPAAPDAARDPGGRSHASYRRATDKKGSDDQHRAPSRPAVPD